MTNTETDNTETDNTEIDNTETDNTEAGNTEAGNNSYKFMELKGKTVILASGSPRRRELLAGLGVKFEVDTENSFEESFGRDVEGAEVPVILSRGKSYGFHRELLENEILITSDTVVLTDCPRTEDAQTDGKKVLGKPHSREEAEQMLRELSGRSHEVVTAVTLRSPGRCKTLSDTATVHFKTLTDDEIRYYIDKCKPFDKAGSYGIQEWIGYIGISRIEGSFFTIMGFPTHLVYEGLLDFIG